MCDEDQDIVENRNYIDEAQLEPLCEYTGEFIKFLWRDDESGHSYLLIVIWDSEEDPLDEIKFKEKSTRQNIISGEEKNVCTIFCDATGINVPQFCPCFPVKIKGYWGDVNASQVRDFVVTAIEYCADDSTFMVDFLSSTKDLHIKYGSAVKIIKQYGADIFSLVNQDNATELVAQLTGLKDRNVDELIRTLRTMKAEYDLFKMFAGMGISISYSMCVKAVKELGVHAEQLFLEDPYSYGKQFGLSFLQCDKIAISIGMRGTSPERYTALSEEALANILANGDTWCSQEHFYQEVLKITSRNLGDDEYFKHPYLSDIITKVLGVLVCDKFSGIHGIASANIIEREYRSARSLLRIARFSPDPEPYQDSMLDELETACGIKYGEQQRQAIKDIMSTRGTSVLVGGPGTGKTTIIKAIIYIYKKMHPTHNIRLCAPTGRAAQRMVETSGYPATTIHRLMEYKPFEESLYHKDHTDPIEADMIIIDESSMIDSVMFDMFLDAVKSGTKLIFVGDPDQIGPVGPGKVLKDLLSMDDKYIHKNYLKEIYRQSRESSIIQNAYKILHKDTSFKQDDNFQIINARSLEDEELYVTQLMSRLYDPNDPFSAQVLCLMKKGTAGVYEMNKKLQELLNPQPGASELTYGETCFRIGDKVMMQHNHYTDGTYYNGEIGLIQEIYDDHLIVQMHGEDITIGRDCFDDISLAFAITVHKAQGSEFENVIIVLTKSSPRMLVNNLIYTAVTRGTQNVYIIQEPGALDEAIRNIARERNTTLLSDFQTLISNDDLISQEGYV